MCVCMCRSDSLNHEGQRVSKTLLPFAQLLHSGEVGAIYCPLLPLGGMGCTKRGRLQIDRLTVAGSVSSSFLMEDWIAFECQNRLYDLTKQLLLNVLSRFMDFENS